METNIAIAERNHIESVLPIFDWAKLTDIVAAFSPDIIVLVARKMPRLMECLGLNFNKGALVLSDFAIPFAHNYFKGARVAIVDDSINIGTTLCKTYQSVKACGARDIHLFALGAKENNTVDQKNLLDMISAHVDYVNPRKLKTNEHTALVKSIPLALGFTAKPYDLEFPILSCRFTAPYKKGTQIYEWLQNKFGKESTHTVDRPIPSAMGFLRFTVDVGSNLKDNYKLRLYINEKAKTCNLVPFAIPAIWENGAQYKSSLSNFISTELLKSIETAPGKAETFCGESKYRLNLFLYSLDFGLHMLDKIGEILTIDSTAPFNLADASMLFGPGIQKIFENLPTGTEKTGFKMPGHISVNSESQTEVSPFYRDFICSSDGELFLDLVRKRAGENKTPYNLFTSFFEELSEKTGASSPSDYSFCWPYSKEEIIKDPYLRLRIGPTFGDLIKIMMQLGDAFNLNELTGRSLVSELLDRTIDDGAVVPTIANYCGDFFRISRKGENEFHDLVADRINYSVNRLNRKISLTRLAKILSIMSFYKDGDGLLVPSSMPRGNTASFKTTVVDKSTAEITHYLRNIGKLKRFNK